MARLPYLQKEDVSPQDRDLLKLENNLIRLLVHSPESARAFLHLGAHIRHSSKIDPRLRELGILQVGYSTKSAYEYSHHIKIGRQFGVSDDDIKAIAMETDGQESNLPALDKAVLKAAREMTRDLRISDETFEILRMKLDRQMLVDLILTLSFYNGVVRLLATLDIDVETEYQQYLEKFPISVD